MLTKPLLVRLRLPKAALIRRSGEYQRIYAQGRRVRGDGFALVYQLTSSVDGARLGISVSGIKSAVRRNRIKRIIREFFRLRRPLINPNLELIFTVCKGFTPDTPSAVAAALRRPTQGRLALAGLTDDPPAVRGGPLSAVNGGPFFVLRSVVRRLFSGSQAMIRSACLAGVRFYQLVISPLLPPSCRFVPSCSQYALEAITLHGVWGGGLMVLKRILRCHPFSPGGFDPVK